MLSTVESLERFEGHLLNWYETKTLAPLLPRYVSTVDSGNLAASLLSVASGVKRILAGGPRRASLLCESVRDTAGLLEEAVRSFERTSLDPDRGDDPRSSVRSPAKGLVDGGLR